MKQISKTKAKNLITNSNGAFFSVDFVKKDGTKRTMVCRLGVTKHLTGGELKFDPSECGLMVVFDTTAQDYRMVNLNTMKKLKINGSSYKIA
jgi:hypothetical protein